MSDNLMWHKHEGSHMPVPPECMVRVRDRDGGVTLWNRASDWDWSECGGDTITEFCIDPSQPPCLGGVPEVGASYIRRDGEIVEIESRYNEWWRLKGRLPEEAVDSFGFRYTDHDPMPWDLIARYFPAPVKKEAADPVIVVNTQRKAELDAKHAEELAAAEHAAWLKRRMEKCEANTPKPVAPTPDHTDIVLAYIKAGIPIPPGKYYIRRVVDISKIPAGTKFCTFIGIDFQQAFDQQRESRALSVTAPNANDSWRSGVRLGADQ